MLADFVVLNKFEKRRCGEDALRDVRKQWQRNHAAFGESPTPRCPSTHDGERWNDPGDRLAALPARWSRTAQRCRGQRRLGAASRRATRSARAPDPAARAGATWRRSPSQACAPGSARSLRRMPSAPRRLSAIAAVACRASWGRRLSRRRSSRYPVEGLPRRQAQTRTERLRERYAAALVRPRLRRGRARTLSCRLAGHARAVRRMPRSQEYDGAGARASAWRTIIPQTLSGTPPARRWRCRATDEWGELLRFLRSENLPGRFPFTAGVSSPSSAQARGPDAHVRGRGQPRAHQPALPSVAKRQPAKRLSTAFDSSPSTAAIPTSARTSTARSATPASRSARWTTPRSSTRASTCATRRRPCR